MKTMNSNTKTFIDRTPSYHSDDKELDLVGPAAEFNPESDEEQKNDNKVAIIGAGWIGRALARRIVDANYAVVIGSRSPEDAESNRFDIVCNHVSVAEACRNSDIIILAVPQSAHKNLVPVLVELALNKIVIDCCNRKPHKTHILSAAEELQRNIPGCHVVKAFSDTSAYELNRGPSDKQLRYCGNNDEAKVHVRALMENIGATPRYALHSISPYFASLHWVSQHTGFHVHRKWLSDSDKHRPALRVLFRALVWPGPV